MASSGGGASPVLVATRGTSLAMLHNFGDGDMYFAFCEAAWRELSGPILVYAMPSGLHRKRNLKFEPSMLPAIFLGSVFQDGGKLLGEY